MSWQTVSTLFFVPCCTENISMIELDHSVHCYYWMHFTKGLWEKVPMITRHNYYSSFTKPDQFFFQKELRQFLFIWYGHATTKKVSHEVDETECRWAKCAPSEGNSVGASGAPLRALSSDFVVLSSASERPETELFQCRCSLGVFVTEDSSVKTKRGKLSVEMTDQPFVTKWTICTPNEVFFFARKTITLAPQTLL